MPTRPQSSASSLRNGSKRQLFGMMQPRSVAPEARKGGSGHVSAGDDSGFPLGRAMVGSDLGEHKKW